MTNKQETNIRILSQPKLKLLKEGLIIIKPRGTLSKLCCSLQQKKKERDSERGRERIKRTTRPNLYLSIQNLILLNKRDY
jgi:ribosomal protein L19E